MNPNWDVNEFKTKLQTTDFQFSRLNFNGLTPRLEHIRKNEA